jgi:hypothetical protein
MPAARDAIFSERDLTGNAAASFVCTGRNIAASRMVKFWFLGNGGTATALTSVASPNLTWTRAVQAVDAGNNNRAECWTAWCASALTAEVITVTGAGSYNRRSYVTITVSGSDSSGVGNTATDIDGTPADPAISISATAADSYLSAGLVARGSGGDQTVDGNTTSEYSSGSFAGFSFQERVYSRTSTGIGGHTLASTGDDPLNWLMAGIEIKAAGGGGGATYPGACGCGVY